jgi:hypothetical protein
MDLSTILSRSLKFNKRFFLIFALIGIVFLAFLPIIGITEVHAVQPAVVQTRGCTQCGTLAYSGSVTSGNLLVFAFNQVGGTSCDASGVLSDSLGNSFFRLFSIGNPGYANDAICAYYVTSAYSGADTITFQATESSAIIFELFDFTTNGSVNTQGGFSSASTTGGTFPYHASTSIAAGVLTVELATGIAHLANGSDIGCLSQTSGYTIPSGGSACGGYNGSAGTPAALGAYLFGIGGSNQNFPVVFTWSGTDFSGTQADIVGFTLTALNPYQPYSTYVDSYSTSAVISYCQDHNAVCTNETSTSTWSYDNTRTTILITTCSTSDSGNQYCVTQTTSYGANVTYTATSAILTTSTVTTTTTATAVLAPTQESLLYWFFGFVALLVPPATLVGIRANSGSGGEDFIPLILIGLFVGALLGLILNVLPWEFMVVFGAILALYVIRGRF